MVGGCKSKRSRLTGKAAVLATVGTGPERMDKSAVQN